MIKLQQTDVNITHPDVVKYDWNAAWDDPIESDKTAYLDNRTGILTQAAPNIGPMVSFPPPPLPPAYAGKKSVWLTLAQMWEEITVVDGSIRQLQWTARVQAASPSLLVGLFPPSSFWKNSVLSLFLSQPKERTRRTN